MSPIAYLFVTHDMSVGGIETLLTRMASAIAELGQPVTVAGPPGPMVKLLHPAIKWISTKEIGGPSGLEFDKLVPVGTLHLNIWTSLPILAVGMQRLQRRLWSRKGISSSLVSGVFHPAQIRRDPGLTTRNIVALAIQLLTPPGAIYFMNDATRAAHIDRWGAHLQKWPVHRLALTPPRGKWQPEPHNRKKLRIVSVGRLVPFKAYNWGAIETCIRLRKRGVDVVWDIWGEGDDRRPLQQAIDAAGLQDAIALRGTLAYDRLLETVAGYDVFVGMGTAALEAAHLAMPTILSIVSLSQGTYGFLASAPSDTVGEAIADVPVQNLTDNLTALLDMTEAARVRLGEACLIAATARIGSEQPPYDSMFAAGHRVPDTLFRNFGFSVLGTLLHLKRSRQAQE